MKYHNKIMKRSVKLKSREPFILILIFILTSIILITNKLWLIQKQFILSWRSTNGNFSCYDSSDGDALKPFTKKRNTRSIFFHETSCRGGLTSREACAVESAARAHPNWQVYLLFSSPVGKQTLEHSNLYVLQQYSNVEIARIYIDEYTKGVWPQDVLKDIKNSTHTISHSADLLRIATLFLWGGVYLDLDVVVVRALDELPKNWIAKQLDSELAFGTMALSTDEIGTKISTNFVKTISDYYNPSKRFQNGLIHEALKSVCPAAILFPAGRYCHGLYVYGPDLFYPVYYVWARKYFDPGDLSIVDNGLNPYMHHVWNGLTWNVTVDKDSPYEKLAKKFCPRVYEIYGDDFGI